MTNIGRPVWYELLTSDPVAAIAFYTEVLGWTTQPFGNGYTMFAAAQGPLGGVTQLPETAKKMGAPPHWLMHVQVANVDASVDQVQSLGGKLLVREDVPEVGRFAIVSDPQGAVVSLYTPTRDMPPHDASQAGEFSWHELYTSDHEAAFAFYQKVAGWERVAEHDMGPMGIYLLWGRGGKEVGGMMTLPKGMKSPDGREIPPSWMYYVTAPDLDGTLARAKSKGATVLNGPMAVPGGQRIVQLMDPQGAAFALATPRPA